MLSWESMASIYLSLVWCDPIGAWVVHDGVMHGGGAPAVQSGTNGFGAPIEKCHGGSG